MIANFKLRKNPYAPKDGSPMFGGIATKLAVFTNQDAVVAAGFLTKKPPSMGTSYLDYEEHFRKAGWNEETITKSLDCIHAPPRVKVGIRDGSIYLSLGPVDPVLPLMPDADFTALVQEFLDAMPPLPPSMGIHVDAAVVGDNWSLKAGSGSFILRKAWSAVATSDLIKGCTAEFVTVSWDADVVTDLPDDGHTRLVFTIAERTEPAIGSALNKAVMTVTLPRVVAGLRCMVMRSEAQNWYEASALDLALSGRLYVDSDRGLLTGLRTWSRTTKRGAAFGIEGAISPPYAADKALFEAMHSQAMVFGADLKAAVEAGGSRPSQLHRARTVIAEGDYLVGCTVQNGRMIIWNPVTMAQSDGTLNTEGDCSADLDVDYVKSQLQSVIAEPSTSQADRAAAEQHIRLLDSKGIKAFAVHRSNEKVICPATGLSRTTFWSKAIDAEKNPETEVLFHDGVKDITMASASKMIAGRDVSALVRTSLDTLPSTLTASTVLAPGKYGVVLMQDDGAETGWVPLERDDAVFTAAMGAMIQTREPDARAHLLRVLGIASWSDLVAEATKPEIFESSSVPEYGRFDADNFSYAGFVRPEKLNADKLPRAAVADLTMPGKDLFVRFVQTNSVSLNAYLLRTPL